MSTPSHHSRPSRVAIAFAAVVFGATGACASLAHSPSVTGPDDARIVFVNQSTDEADVYAVMQSGEAARLGTVLPGHGDTLTIPAALVSNGGGISIAARLLAEGSGPRTGLISLGSGDLVEIILQADERVMRIIRLRNGDG